MWWSNFNCELKVTPKSFIKSTCKLIVHSQFIIKIIHIQVSCIVTLYSHLQPFVASSNSNSLLFRGLERARNASDYLLYYSQCSRAKFLFVFSLQRKRRRNQRKKNQNLKTKIWALDYLTDLPIFQKLTLSACFLLLY